MGEDLEPCILGALGAGFADHGLGRVLLDTNSLSTGTLAAAAPDVEPDLLVEILEGAWDECADVEAQGQRLVEQLTSDGFPPEMATCVMEAADEGGIGRGFVIRMVYGPESPRAVEVDGRQRVAMLRCGLEPMAAQWKAQGIPEPLSTCMLDAQERLADAIEADPSSYERETGEAATNARAVACRAVMPPFSTAGQTRSTVGADRFTAAVRDELVQHPRVALTPRQAECLATVLVGPVDGPRSITAAELVAYFDGAYAPGELGLAVDAETVGAMASDAVRCLGTELLRFTSLFDGNFDDALGRPSSPAHERDDLVECSLAAVDMNLVQDFLSVQFAVGPDAWTSPAGRELLGTSFAAVQQCADDLGIARQEPLNGI